MSALGNNVHIYARPESREQLVRCFTDILGGEAVASADGAGPSAPILAFRFPGGGALSVEFTEDALDERRARRGAWLEVRVDDPAAVRRKILAAGLPRVTHPGNDHFYFAAPGGQVLRVVQAPRPAR